MGKIEQLMALAAELEANKKLPLMESNLVFGEGDSDATVLFIGEAPGVRENELRRPFVGRSGLLLDKMFATIDWKREQVYITNIVKRRPPDNRDPLPAEIEAYKPYLARQIEILKPKIIAPLGRFSMNYFLPEAKISRDQGKLFKVYLPGQVGDYFIYPLFHPAAALRSTTNYKALEDAFTRLPAALAKCESLLLDSLK